jgi:hypothetical protein
MQMTKLTRNFICGTMLLLCVLAVQAADQPTICYFTLLPIEVLDKIALLCEWDDRETDEAFITRAEKYGMLSPEHMALVQKRRAYNIDDPHDAWIFSTYSIDRTKIIFFEHAWIHQGWDPAKVINEASIIDIATDVTKKSARIAQLIKKHETVGLESRTTHHIALSRTGTHLAQLQHRQQVPFELDTTKAVLVVTEIATGIKKEYIFMSFYFCQDFQSISFNKQGTKVIAIGDASLKKHAMQRIVTHKEHEEKSIMTFDLFLKTHGICKSYGKEKNEL